MNKRAIPVFLTSLNRKKIASIGIALLLIIVAIATYKHTNSSIEEYTRVTVQTGTIEDVVTAQGKLEPKEYVDVGTQVSGQIKKLHVDIGDTVEKGALLAEIDPRLYEAKVEADTAQLKSLRAQLAEQQANLVLAKRQHARNEQLIKTNAISIDAFDETNAALKAAQAKVGTQLAQIEQVESTLKGDTTNLEFTKIYAPMSGTVASLPAREGQTLNANQTAPLLMQLADLDTMTVRAQVAEADISRLKIDMSVYFTTLGSLNHRWQGAIRQILPTPEVINDVVLYDVLIDVDNHDHTLMNGMSTQVFFVVGRAENVPTLPVEALGKRTTKEDNESGQAYRVRVANNGDTEERTIHTGLSDRVNTQIIDGLAEGDIVLVPAHKPATGANTGKGNQRSGGGRMPMGPRL